MPWALETKRSAFGIAPVTPSSAFFVRNNLPAPNESIVANRDDWRFEVAGTKQNGSMTLGELKALPIHIVATVLQCSGNGRAYFSHHPSGSPWATGAAGCGLWTGVRVGDVIDKFGGSADNKLFLTATGAESLPEGVDPNSLVVERSVPVEKGLEDSLLVWEMNGEPLPLIHGGPLRLIVPGYFGVNNVKWVKRIALTVEESGASIQRSGYRFRDIGESGSPAHPSMYRMPVKSWINGPGADDSEPVNPGQHTLYGVAFSGEHGIKKVEISADGGKSWFEAQLVGPDLGPNAWRSFVYATELKLGTYRFVSRATDNTGETQPREATPNERGYAHNGWYDPALELKVITKQSRESKPELATSSATALAAIPPAAISLSPLAARGKDIFIGKAAPSCGVCHTLADAGSAGIIGPNFNQLKPSADQVFSAVSQGVGVMPSYSKQLTQDEMRALAAYLAEATSG
ncbi:sulfite oxidase [Paraglaciecola polaris LMG 21857]|uniref:Sulfite oxidase n=2 Tax=Paraglaciecola polaris TaxID=222814 RepID=K7AJL3_9ALTE|nr:sulfite oxidase [Paraglaciecola polaris LMG 21857]